MFRLKQNYFANNNVKMALKLWLTQNIKFEKVSSRYIKILYLQNLPANNNIGFSGSKFLVVEILPIVLSFDWVTYIKGNKKQIISWYLT